MTSCKRVIYSGHVQGVGFRYTAQQLAKQFPVTGYVQNLPSGEVELVAEGETQEVERFLEAVAQRLARYIQHCTVAEATPLAARDFRIRY